MVTAVQIRRKVKARRARKQQTAALLPPMTGAQVVAYWEREGLGGVYSDPVRFPQDSPELARLLRKQAETPDAENRAFIALLRQWCEEDDAMTEAEAAQADKDTENFKAGMNANRAANGERPVYQ